MSNLCATCRQLDFATISCETQYKVVAYEQVSSNHDDYGYRFSGHDATVDADAAVFKASLTPYHNSLQSLFQAARPTSSHQEGCQLCSLVLQSVIRVLDAKERARKQGWTVYEPRDSWKFSMTGKRHGGKGIAVIGFNSAANLNVPEHCKSYSLMAVLEFCVKELETLSCVIATFDIPSDPRTPVLMAKVRHWIQGCKESHGHHPSSARTLKSSVMPSRVLNISEDGETIVLRRDCLEHKKQYVALSYCWGHTATLRLTSSNIAKMSTTGAQVTELPLTYRDAIWTTLSLGYRNLWIDSLCIQQDDRNDWERELAKMHDIYSNAVVTIAADRGSDSAAGFLGLRATQEHAVIPYRAASNRTGDMHASSVDNLELKPACRGKSVTGQVMAFLSPLTFEFWEPNIAKLQDEPLSTRAWTLQERMLSTRIIHFTSTGLHLECDRDFISEKHILPLPSVPCSRHFEDGMEHGFGKLSMPTNCACRTASYGSSSHAESKPKHSPKRISLLRGGDIDSQLFKIHWKDLVCAFSRRRLTLPSDKLPALAGIAIHLANLFDNEMGLQLAKPRKNEELQPITVKCRQYHAGLFLSDDGRIDPLLWEIDDQFHRRRKLLSPSEETGPRRPHTYRAPTWSWASLDGAIEWLNLPHRIELATITSAQTVPLSVDNPYGEITSAWLRLNTILGVLHLRTGKDGELVWFMDAPGLHMSECILNVLPRWDTGEIYSGPRRFSPPSSLKLGEDGTTNLRVAILRGDGDEGTLDITYDGLILEPVISANGGEEGYQRLGTAQISGNDDHTWSRGYLQILEKLFNSGEGTSEIVLY